MSSSSLPKGSCEKKISPVWDDGRLQDFKSWMTAEVAAINHYFGMPEKWHLQYHLKLEKKFIQYQDLTSHYNLTNQANDAAKEEGVGQVEMAAISLIWGDQKIRPNGYHSFIVEDENEDGVRDMIIEQIYKTALQSVLILGRDQELREAGLDPASPPLWARVTTPMFERILSAHRNITKKKNKWLGEQPIHENGAIIEPDGTYRLNERVAYCFSWWRGAQYLDLRYNLPETVMSTLDQRKLSELVSFPGVDLTGIDAEMSPREQGGIIVVFSRSDLVRLAKPPEGIEEDPVVAWSEAARRTTS